MLKYSLIDTTEVLMSENQNFRPGVPHCLKFLNKKYLEVVFPLMEGRKNLFNDQLNTLYLWLYGIGHMAKNHRGYERRDLLLQFHGHSFCGVLWG